MAVDADRNTWTGVKEKDLSVLISSSWVIEWKQVIVFSPQNVAGVFQAHFLQM